MRSLFLLALFANFLLFALGTGAFGPPPQEQGRDPARAQQQLRPENVAVKPLSPVSSAPAR